jgi:hypothetical protein
MKSGESDYRPIGLAVTAIAVVAGLWVAVASRPSSQFEWQHLHAEAANPKWLKVEITTADKRSQYRENEPIYIVPHFSSSVRYKYKIEIAEGESESAVDYLHISNGQVVPRNLVGIFCCFSRLVGLDDEPYSPATVTPLKLSPGRYEIYLTTRRVFTWDVGPEEYSPSSFEVASNLLRIRVVPAK